MKEKENSPTKPVPHIMRLSGIPRKIVRRFVSIEMHESYPTGWMRTGQSRDFSVMLNEAFSYFSRSSLQSKPETRLGPFFNFIMTTGRTIT